MQWSIKPQNSLVGAVFQFLLRNFFRCFATGKWHEISMLYSSCCCLCDKSHCNFCLYLFFFVFFTFTAWHHNCQLKRCQVMSVGLQLCRQLCGLPPAPAFVLLFSFCHVTRQILLHHARFRWHALLCAPLHNPQPICKQSLACLQPGNAADCRYRRQATSKAASQSHTF